MRKLSTTEWHCSISTIFPKGILLNEKEEGNISSYYLVKTNASVLKCIYQCC